MKFHPLLAVTGLESILTPSANKLTVIESGLNPSWSSASSQVLTPSTFVNSGVCLLVIVVISPFVSLDTNV